MSRIIRTQKGSSYLPTQAELDVADCAPISELERVGIPAGEQARPAGGQVSAECPSDGRLFATREKYCHNGGLRPVVRTGYPRPSVSGGAANHGDLPDEGTETPFFWALSIRALPI
jgi:hypothetical protein